MNGEVGILNVGSGDTKLLFDKDNPVETERAKGIVQDMLKRGYAILVQVGEKDGEPLFQRAKGFDPATCEYIIASGPDEVIDLHQDPALVAVGKRQGRQPKERRIKAGKTRAVSVARISGG